MEKKHIVILNGPNLNLVGTRQVEIYGRESFDTFIPLLKAEFSDIDITYHQSNHEGVLIDLIQQYGYNCDGIILNAGGYTHTSIALRDAISSIVTPVIEVHLSDIYNREEFRKINFIKDVCTISIVGKGLNGYREGIKSIVHP